MDRQRVNKLLSLMGSFCLSNGLLLLLAPARFAQLRQLAWMPPAYNRMLAQVPPHPRVSRALGSVLVVSGLGLLLLAVRRTEPAG